MTARRGAPPPGMRALIVGMGQLLQSLGTKGDTVLAHINPREVALLKAHGGAGTRDPLTGLLQFDPGEGTSGGDAGGGGPGGAGGSPGDGSAADSGAGSGGTGGGGTGQGSDASPGPGPSQGGDKSSGQIGSGGGAQTDTAGPAGTGPSGASNPGEIGTGHGLGASISGKGFGGGLPDAGLPEGATAFTGIDIVDKALNQAVAHPGITAANIAFGAVPVAGQINTAFGLANLIGDVGLPTAGSLAAGAFTGASGQSGPNQDSASGPGGGAGYAGIGGTEGTPTGYGLTPVEHDPFTQALVPVDHDPFAEPGPR